MSISGVTPKKTVKEALEEVLQLLQPARSTPMQDYSGSISGGQSINIDKSNLDGWNAIAAIIKVTYNASAMAGIRARWLYSPDGSNYDSPEEAEDAGNYEDLTFTAGATRQRTIVVPILAPYVRVQVVNRDPYNSHSITVWTVLVRW